MPVKVSQLSPLTVLNGTVLVPVVDVGTITPVSKRTTIGDITSFILAGNAATATKLETPRTINGVNFDGTQDIVITSSLAIATTTTLGGVIIGDGINVGVDGTISVPTRLFHGFRVDSTGNLIYSTTSDSSISLQDRFGKDIYEDTDIGTSDYSYSMDSDGNLIVTFS
jgi:hypothetical protein